MDRLRKQFEIMSICPGSLKQIGSRSLSGKKQNLASRTELPQCNRKLNPGKFWHYDIRNEQFRGLLFGSQKRFQRIRKRDRVEPASLQNRLRKHGMVHAIRTRKSSMERRTCNHF